MDRKRAIIIVFAFLVVRLSTTAAEPFAIRSFGSEAYGDLERSRHDDPGWSGPLSVIDGDVTALATRGDVLYVGGFFKTIDGEVVNHIARWDGTAWSALGEGLDHVVYALATGADGSLFAGGAFSRGGNREASFIARWDGEAWHDVGGGMNNIVQGLYAAPGGVLFAGGGFTRAGSTDAAYIAQWDGTRWSAVGDGMNHNVISLAGTEDGTLYAGGGFTMAGGVTAYQIARWDGSAWHALQSGMNIPMFGRPVWALAVDRDGKLYAGGNFDTAGDAAAANVARWDGRRWSKVGAGLDGNVHALVFDERGTLYAGGYFRSSGAVELRHVAAWDGRDWASLGTGTDAVVHALSIDESGVLHVGGAFVQAGWKPATRLACWNPRVASARSVSELDVHAPEVSVSVIPHPFQDAATIEVDLPRDQHVKMTVYDVVGRRWVVLVDDHRAAGIHHIELDASRWPSGFYLYVLNLSTGRYSGIMVLRR